MIPQTAIRAFRCLLTALALLILPAGLAVAAPVPVPVKVVATFSILADLAAEIGGDAVVVQSLVGAGNDPHVYQPNPGDAAALKDADLVLVNGLGLEGWIDRLVAVSGCRGPVIVASDGVVPLHLVEQGRPATDPHAWQDIANARRYGANIARALMAAAPQQATAIAARAAKFDADLAQLDGWVREQIGTVAPEKRKIITSHDAFGYFAKAYGVTFLAPLGLSTEAEPNPSGLARLIRQMRSEGIKTVFVETMTDPRLAAQLAREGKATLGPPLYSDTLSPPDGPARDYRRMFRYNVTVMVAAMRLN